VSCKKCGECCRLLVIEGLTVDQITSMVNDPNHEFIKNHWVPITLDEAIERYKDGDYTPNKSSTYFRCDQFDMLERRCMSYETRPIICAMFPSYGRNEPVTYLGCGYYLEKVDANQ